MIDGHVAEAQIVIKIPFSVYDHCLLRLIVGGSLRGEGLAHGGTDGKSGCQVRFTTNTELIFKPAAVCVFFCFRLLILGMGTFF